VNDDGDGPVTEKILNLKLAGFRSEMRLLFVVALAGNQLVSHISLSPAAGYIGNGIAVAGALAIKLLVR
jgi:hypothetical protein